MYLGGIHPGGIRPRRDPSRRDPGQGGIQAMEGTTRRDLPIRDHPGGIHPGQGGNAQKGSPGGCLIVCLPHGMVQSLLLKHLQSLSISNIVIAISVKDLPVRSFIMQVNRLVNVDLNYFCGGRIIWFWIQVKCPLPSEDGLVHLQLVLLVLTSIIIVRLFSSCRSAVGRHWPSVGLSSCIKSRQFFSYLAYFSSCIGKYFWPSFIYASGIHYSGLVFRINKHVSLLFF